jgi:creatinine amidohydrolase/Fe(II)-dependent formamide hydrolase-like protein|eukprot:COSAG02_NODE_34_length_49821_cov_105.420438_41_plen_70_part_00
MDIGASVARAGVRKLVIANGHGGNVPLLNVAARCGTPLTLRIVLYRLSALWTLKTDCWIMHIQEAASGA